MSEEIPIITKDIIVPKKFNHSKFVIISDIHYGCKMCDIDFFETVMDWIYKNPEVFVATNGDLLECSTLSSPSLFDQTVNINDQYDYIYNIFKPLADQKRLLFMIRGNHEKRILRDTGYDISRTLAKSLNVNYFESGCAFELNTKSENQSRFQKYTGYMIHGYTSARTVAGRLNKVRKLSEVVNAEMYCYGHVHELFHSKLPFYDINRGRIRKRYKHYILTGSYLKYGGYVQEKGYRPVALGSPKIKLHTDTHRISVSF